MNAAHACSTQWSLAGEDMEVACDNPAHNGGRQIFACCRGAFASPAKLAEWEQERQQKLAAAPGVKPNSPPCTVDLTDSGLEEGEDDGFAPVVTPCIPDIRGAWLYLSRESWGLVVDGLIAQISALESRKRVNPESTADISIAEARKVLCALDPLSKPIAPIPAATPNELENR